MLGETTLSTGNFQIQRSHPLLYNIQLSNVLWEYDPLSDLEGTIIEIDSVAVLSEEIGSDGIRRDTTSTSDQTVLYFNILTGTYY